MRKLVYATLAYAAIMGALAAWRWHLWTWGTDTGTFSQVIGDALGGFGDGPEQGTHFRFHWAPILATLFPLVALTRSPLSLQFAQIGLIALAAFPLYGIARAYVDERSAWRYGALALIYPPACGVAFTEFHEIAFYPALTLGLIWAAERARWRWFALFAIADALVREEACIVLALAGLAFAALGLLRRGAPGEGMLEGAPLESERLFVAGLGLTAINLAALGIYYGIVIPHVGAWQPSRFYDYPFAQGPAALVVALLAHPAYLAQVATLGRFTYVLEAFAPLVFLPLRSRWTWFALPGMLVILLSSDAVTWRMGSHYAAIWIPWLLLGAVAALVHLERRRPAAARRWFAAACASCAIFLIAFNPMHVAHYLRPIYPHDDAQKALALVPNDAPVATHDEWFTRIAYTHRNATVFFCPYLTYAVYADDFPNGYFRTQILPELRSEIRSGQARVVATFGQVKVYRRRPDSGARVGTCITPGNVRFRPKFPTS